MPVDFCESHKRCFNSTEFLLKTKDIISTCQLFSLFVNCNLKAIMKNLKNTIKKDKTIKPFTVNIKSGVYGVIKDLEQLGIFTGG